MHFSADFREIQQRGLASPTYGAVKGRDDLTEISENFKTELAVIEKAIGGARMCSLLTVISEAKKRSYNDLAAFIWDNKGLTLDYILHNCNI